MKEDREGGAKDVIVVVAMAEDGGEEGEDEQEVETLGPDNAFVEEGRGSPEEPGTDAATVARTELDEDEDLENEVRGRGVERRGGEGGAPAVCCWFRRCCCWSTRGC